MIPRILEVPQVSAASGQSALSDGPGLGGLPLAGQQVGDVLHRVVEQTGDQVDQIGLGVDSFLTTIFDQSKQPCQTRTGAGMADLQPVFCAELERANGIFGRIVVQASAQRGQATFERGQLGKQIMQGRPKPGFRGSLHDLLPGLRHSVRKRG